MLSSRKWSCETGSAERARTDCLFQVDAFEGLGRASLFNYQLQRRILIHHNLLIIEQLEETVIGHVFEALIRAAMEKDSKADQGEGDRDEDHAAPIKIGFVSRGVCYPFGYFDQVGT